MRSEGLWESLLQAWKTVAFDFSPWSGVDYVLRPIFMLWLVKIWKVSSCGAENVCSILNLVNLDSWRWQSFVSSCDVFNCLFPLDVQNEIKESSVIHGKFVYWVFGWEIRRLSKSEIRFRMASFSFSPCLICKRVAKSEAILALFDTFQELRLEW